MSELEPFTIEELDNLARDLQLLVLACRRFSVLGDEKNFRRMQGVLAEFPQELVEAASKSVVGCGAGISQKTLDRISKELDERDEQKRRDNVGR